MGGTPTACAAPFPSWHHWAPRHPPPPDAVLRHATPRHLLHITPLPPIIDFETVSNVIPCIPRRMRWLTLTLSLLQATPHTHTPLLCAPLTHILPSFKQPLTQAPLSFELSSSPPLPYPPYPPTHPTPPTPPHPAHALQSLRPPVQTCFKLLPSPSAGTHTRSCCAAPCWPACRGWSRGAAW